MSEVLTRLAGGEPTVRMASFAEVPLVDISWSGCRPHACSAQSKDFDAHSRFQRGEAVADIAARRDKPIQVAYALPHLLHMAGLPAWLDTASIRTLTCLACRPTPWWAMWQRRPPRGCPRTGIGWQQRLD